MNQDRINHENMLGIIESSHNTAYECLCDVHGSERTIDEEGNDRSRQVVGQSQRRAHSISYSLVMLETWQEWHDTDEVSVLTDSAVFT